MTVKKWVHTSLKSLDDKNDVSIVWRTQEAEAFPEVTLLFIVRTGIGPQDSLKPASSYNFPHLTKVSPYSVAKVTSKIRYWPRQIRTAQLFLIRLVVNSKIRKPLYYSSSFSSIIWFSSPTALLLQFIKVELWLKNKTKLHCSLIAFLFKDSNLGQNVIRTTLLVSTLIDIYVFMSTELPCTDWFISGNYL